MLPVQVVEDFANQLQGQGGQKAKKEGVLSESIPEGDEPTGESQPVTPKPITQQQAEWKALERDIEKDMDRLQVCACPPRRKPSIPFTFQRQ